MDQAEEPRDQDKSALAWNRPGVADQKLFEFWPAFNVADSAITCSVVSLIIYELFMARRTSGKDSEEKPS